MPFCCTCTSSLMILLLSLSLPYKVNLSQLQQMHNFPRQESFALSTNYGHVKHKYLPTYALTNEGRRIGQRLVSTIREEE
jgi:hypothetical protein